MVGWLRYRRSV